MITTAFAFKKFFNAFSPYKKMGLKNSLEIKTYNVIYSKNWAVKNLSLHLNSQTGKAGCVEGMLNSDLS